MSRSIGRYVAKRLLLTLPTLLVVAILVFSLVRMIPGDPAQVMLGESADAEAIAALRGEMGLDQPLWTQFLTWIGDVLRGDLGTSIITGDAVGRLVLERFGVTATIVVGKTRPPETLSVYSCFSWFAPVVAARQMSRDGLAERTRNWFGTDGEGSRHVHRLDSGFAVSA